MRNKPYPLYDVPDIRDLRELIARDVERFGDTPAFAFFRDGQRVDVTYRQLDRDIEALGTSLLRRGLTRAKIAVVGDNSYEWMLVFLTAMNSGNIIVPIDKELPAAEIRSLLERTDPALIYYSDRLSADRRAEFDPAASICLQTGLESMIAEGRAAIDGGDHSFADIRLDPDALAAIIFTSGTTSAPKGVMLSHKSLATDLTSAWRNISVRDSMLLVLPLHHTFALVGSVLAPMFNGMTIQIVTGLRQLPQEMKMFQPVTFSVVPLFLENFYRQIWKTIEKSGRTRLVKFMMVVVRALLACGIDVRRRVFRDVLEGFGGRVEILISGGAPIDPELIETMRIFGVNVLNGYGISECSPIIATIRNDYHRDGSVGSPLECNEVKIDRPGPDGVGEICARGANVMLGYYEDEAATAAVMEDGWFHTGDLGKFDDDGFLWVTGRLKNLIICSNGENVSAEELEALMQRLDLVSEVVVTQRDGAITAEVFPEQQQCEGMSADQVTAALREAVNEINRTQPSYRRIKNIIVRDKEFEKTTSMKIKRY